MSRALKRGAVPVGPRRDPWVKVLPYVDTIHGLLAEGVWNAMVILREIQALGYAGSYTTLKAYVRPQRVMRPSPATVRFETAPGRQLQSDWGQIVVRIAGVDTTVHFIVNTLGYSRRMHVSAGSHRVEKPNSVWKQPTVRFETGPGRQAQVDWGSTAVEIGGEDVRVHLFVMTLGFSRRMFVRAYPNERLAALIDDHERARGSKRSSSRRWCDRWAVRPRAACQDAIRRSPPRLREGERQARARTAPGRGRSPN